MKRINLLHLCVLLAFVAQLTACQSTQSIVDNSVNTPVVLIPQTGKNDTKATKPVIPAISPTPANVTAKTGTSKPVASKPATSSKTSSTKKTTTTSSSTTKKTTTPTKPAVVPTPVSKTPPAAPVTQPTTPAPEVTQTKSEPIVPDTSIGTITGRVIVVTDGDTFSMFDENNRLQTIDLAGIDAPEAAQRYGMQAKNALFSMVFDKEIKVKVQGTRGSAKVGRVLVGNTDTSTEQIRKGMAWADRTMADAELISLENSAKTAKKGLWADENPTPPWTFKAP